MGQQGAFVTGRRVHERFECDLVVAIDFEGKETPAKASNISLGGVFIATGSRIPYGSSVTLRFRVPALKEDAQVAGIVRWQKPDGLGIQFGSLRALEVWALNQYFKGLSTVTV